MLSGQASGTNDRLTQLQDDWNECLRQLREGEVVLDGLSLDLAFIETYQTDNPSADDVGPVFEIDEEF